MRDTPVQELVQRCLKGDAAASAEFIARYSELVYRTVAKTLAQHHAHPPVRADVDDITNDVLEHLLRENCRKFESVRDAQKLEPWLVAVARNRTVDYLRQWSRRLRVPYEMIAMEEQAAYPAPDAQMIHDEEKLRTTALLQSLAPRDRLVLELYYVHGMKYGDIAGMTGMKPGAVGVALHRARQRLLEKQHAQDE